MARGNSLRAWTYQEYVDEFEKLEVENNRMHQALTAASSEFTRVYRKLKELEDENKKILRTMQLHAGDCCSLNNEVELFRGHWLEAEERCRGLEKENRRLREALQSWITVNEGAPNKYEWAEKALKGGGK